MNLNTSILNTQIGRFILQGSNSVGILVSLKAKPAIILYVIVNVLTESREFMLHFKTKIHFIIYVGLYVF